ncbi:MAG: inorganic pyrophosphatase [Candidatus Aenigmarchaeota archaeon ex4484_56]|nr:MAG: inorganic pyrophosphatase [Candidatus Aenigmarchaeota archaeon ex4484_56]
MNLWKDLDIGKNPPEEIFAVIEIPKRCQNKYEYDHEKGVFILDRVLYPPMFYPTNYAFVPKTWSKDEDPLDIMVISDEPFVQGSVILVRPVCLLRMIDTGEVDNKILSVPVKDPRYKDINSKSDVNQHLLEEIAYFFKRYKELEGKTVEIIGWNDKEKAIDEINEAIENFKLKFA